MQPERPEMPEEPLVEPELPDQPEEPTVEPQPPDQPEEPTVEPQPPDQPEEPTAAPEPPDQSEEPTAAPEPPDQPEEPTAAPELPDQPAEPEKAPAPLRRGDIFQATVVSVDARGAVVTLAEPEAGDPVRQAVVPIHDLEKLDAKMRESVQEGATPAVYIVTPQDREGKIVASIHQAVLNQEWLEAEQLLQSGEIWQGKVKGYNQGGAIVPFGRLRGFVPISQLLNMPRRGNPMQVREHLGHYVGRTLPLQVIQVDRRRRRLILSYRRAYPIWREQQRQEFIDNLKVGQIHSGRVRELRDFGAFVDLGEADGLIHISELAWYRVDHPKEILRVGQPVEVLILKVNRRRRRIGLSLKRLKPHPWDQIETRYRQDELVEGKVLRVTDFGAFVELEPGIEGLLHYKHLPRTTVDDPRKVVSEGEVHLLRIINIDTEQRRIRLSMRAVSPEEQMEWMTRRAEEETAQVLADTIGLAELLDEEE
jgi:small subunit ribosomal protein S1